MGGSSEELTVQSLERVEDAPYDAPHAVLGLASHEKWGPIVQRALALSPNDVKAQAAELAKAADAAFAQHQPVDALLLFLESYLMTGDASEGFKSTYSLLSADPSAAQVEEAIHPHTAEEAKASLATLADLRKTHPDRAEVIRIFEGNIHNNLGETDAAYEHLHAVLTARPAIAGVWHDLGGMFLNAYSANEAWDSWEMMRRLAPQHGMAEDIDQREAKLMQLYPEYF